MHTRDASLIWRDRSIFFLSFFPFPLSFLLLFFFSLNNYMRVDVLYSRRDLRYTILNARSPSRDAINWNRVPREERERIHGVELDVLFTSSLMKIQS